LKLESSGTFNLYFILRVGGVEDIWMKIQDNHVLKRTWGCWGQSQTLSSGSFGSESHLISIRADRI